MDTAKVSFKYRFETDQFGISETGIHLLRSRFNYETIGFEVIDEIIIERGRQIKNWLLVFLLGIGFLIGSLFYSYTLLYEFFIGTTVHRFYVEQFVIPVIPAFLGVFMIFNALKKGLRLRLSIKQKTKTFSLEELKKNGELALFLDFLANYHLTRSKLKQTEISLQIPTVTIQNPAVST